MIQNNSGALSAAQIWRLPFLAVVKDYVSLAKPGVISLLLISTCCPMILASAGEVRLSAILWALVGGALVSGSAGVINCIWDRDIDAIMERTKARPIPAGRVGAFAAQYMHLLLGRSV